MNKFKLFKLFKKQRDQFTDVKVKHSLQHNGLAETIKAINVRKEPSSLEAVYKFSSEEQFHIMVLADLKASIDRGDCFIPNEGRSVFFPESIRMLKEILESISGTGEYNWWLAYEDCIEMYPQFKDIIDKFHPDCCTGKYVREVGTALRAYECWYNKYSHYWKDNGESYFDICNEFRCYPYLLVEEKPLSEYIEDIQKYYKYYIRVTKK